MKHRTAVTATVLFTVAAALAAPAAAQNTAGANAPKYGVAVVDINYVFKQHKSFRDKKKALNDKVKGIESQLEGDRNQLVSLEERKKTFQPSAPEFIELDAQITRMKADLQIKLTKLRKGIMEDEAALFYETYQQVSQVIAGYAKHYKIGLVLKFNGDVADPKNPRSIQAELLKPVQFQDQIDITPDIVALVNRATVGQGAGATRR